MNLPLPATREEPGEGFLNTFPSRPAGGGRGGLLRLLLLPTSYGRERAQLPYKARRRNRRDSPHLSPPPRGGGGGGNALTNGHDLCAMVLSNGQGHAPLQQTTI